ncbi:Mitochondrial ribosome-associated GTPase 1 [Bagarius yarrelli]|uniref:Mitochondrial ribosome-associated GTPase 1 n=1 Tax=Bagarius yarrelli TaxID=175774 RepID=A0A556TMN4_BAGYA|nr:Mitochondrial ribosome-associated GTPase 1 [Bagarius yarrelli]
METVQHLAEGLYKAVFQITRRLWANMKAIHLDAATAHPNLEVTADLLEVRWNKINRQESKDTEHVTTDYSILAKESLISGFHYWETAVWEKPYWLIGLSYECNSKDRAKNATTFINKTFCYIYHGNGRYLVCNGSEETVLAVEKRIQKVGVSVDLEIGTVSFYDADTLRLLHLFAVEFLAPNLLKQLERDGVRNVLFTDCLKQSDTSIKKVIPHVTALIENAPRFHREENRSYCLMVIGVPNVGKSSLINALRRTNLKKGTILDHLVGEDIIADYLLFTLNRLQRFGYVERYDLEAPSNDIQHVLKCIAVKLGKTQRVKAITGVGDITVRLPNYTAAAYNFIRAFRKGELGKVMLD